MERTKVKKIYVDICWYFVLFFMMMPFFNCNSQKAASSSDQSCEESGVIIDMRGMDGCEKLLLSDAGEWLLLSEIPAELSGTPASWRIAYTAVEMESSFSICMMEDKVVTLTCLDIIDKGDGLSSCTGIPVHEEIPWMMEVMKFRDPLEIIQLKEGGNFMYLLTNGLVHFTYDCKGNYICESQGREYNSCVERTNKMTGRKVIWTKEN